MGKREGNGGWRGKGDEGKNKRKGRRKERYKGEGEEEAKEQDFVWMWERVEGRKQGETAEEAQGEKGKTWKAEEV